MSGVLSSITETGTHPTGIVPVRAPGRRLQRLGSVRRREGVSLRTMARRLNMTVSDIKRQENEEADVPLSTLYQWQKVLEVPISELLVESSEPLSSPVENRAKLLRIMKTAVTILERTKQTSIRRMAQQLTEQLTDLMPELEGVSPWPAVGKSRLPSDYGQILHRRMSDDVFLCAEAED